MYSIYIFSNHYFNFRLQELQQPAITIMKILIKVKKITMFFNHSCQQTAKLRSALLSKKKSYSNLIQSVSTRWNSTYFMLERIYDCLDEVNTVLCRTKHKLNLLCPEEIAIIPDILALLKPFADLNDPMSSEKNPTISLIIPCVTGLFEELQDVQLKTDQGRELKEELIKATNEHLSSYEQIDFCRYNKLCRIRQTEMYFNGKNKMSIIIMFQLGDDFGSSF